MADETDTQPPPALLTSLAQYVKDLSFENPNAPASLAPREGGAVPEININVNVNATNVGDGQFQVELHLDGSAKFGPDVVFAFDLLYGGLFKLVNVPEDQVHPVVMVQCPNLLFPFARQIVADAVRNGGFPPLYIDPIDFGGLYNQMAAQQAAQAGQAQPRTA
jgi:preprotein translocase subunit SecB